MKLYTHVVRATLTFRFVISIGAMSKCLGIPYCVFLEHEKEQVTTGHQLHSTLCFKMWRCYNMHHCDLYAKLCSFTFLQNALYQIHSGDWMSSGAD